MSSLQTILPAVSGLTMIVGIAGVIFAARGLLIGFKSRIDKNKISKGLPLILISIFLMGIMNSVDGAFKLINGTTYPDSLIVKTVNMVCTIGMFGIFPLAIYQMYLLAKD
jgi:hypothetical protein